MSWHSYLQRFADRSGSSNPGILEPIARICYDYPLLPSDWRQAETGGCIFFFHVRDKKTTWEHPIDKILADFIETISRSPGDSFEEIKRTITKGALLVLTDDISWIESVIFELWKNYAPSVCARMIEENESCSSFGSCCSASLAVYPPGTANVDLPQSVMEDEMTIGVDIGQDSYPQEEVTFSSSQFTNAF
jgi:hypothetical protein